MVIAHLQGGARQKPRTAGRDSGAAAPAYPNPPARVTGAMIILTRRNKWAGPRAGKLWKTYAAVLSIRLWNPR